MSGHDKNLVLMLFTTALLISLNFFVVITGVADGYYEQVTDLLRPILISRY